MEKPYEHLTKQASLIVLLASLPVYFWFSRQGSGGRGEVAALCFAMAVTAVIARWDLRTRWWFWSVILVFAALHLPLVFVRIWNGRGYLGVTLMPIAVLDLGLYCGCLWTIEKLMQRNGPSTPNRVKQVRENWPS